MSTNTHKSGTTGHVKAAPAKSSTEKSKSAQSKENEGKLKEFFHDEIKDIYWAEKKLVQTLPKLAKAATSEELRTAFTSHLEETKEHVSRLEQVFELLGEKAQAKKCDAMEGITEEGASIIEDTEDGTSTRDVALILAGQKAEHYEIATYGGLAQIAQTLGLDEVASLLEATLAEEKAADDKLTDLAEGSINSDASQE
jgi:ferritin-like metal-binding protein YciE